MRPTDFVQLDELFINLANVTHAQVTGVALEIYFHGAQDQAPLILHGKQADDLIAALKTRIGE